MSGVNNIQDIFDKVLELVFSQDNSEVYKVRDSISPTPYKIFDMGYAISVNNCKSPIYLFVPINFINKYTDNNFFLFLQICYNGRKIM